MAACGKVGCLRRAPKQAEYNVRQQGALFALAVLTFVNLLNLLDRYVASSVKPLLQEDLKLSDAESALPTTGMVFVFIVCSALTGWLSDLDLVDRRLTLSIAVLSWSLATALAGLAQNLWQLVVFRSLAHGCTALVSAKYFAHTSGERYYPATKTRNAEMQLGPLSGQ
eukprot:TRINITY_DN14644_c0_g1_i1.p1 TRINITY_DN14644_c0_g1~~TRINITY_DN14644_c0_g1_i1.p1  ORF type:complete len:168 (-),score=8.87 TRINITY_DN14644_c0_g1_i1:28-531(-)